MQPRRIPPTIVGFISAPTSPLSLYRTYSGVMITHSEDSHPLLKAKSDRFKSLNQSALKSQKGPISKAIAMMIGINNVLLN